MSRGDDRTTTTSAVDELTPREREILELIALGLSNDAIRTELWITSKTLDSHVSRIYLKLGLRPSPAVHRRVAAVLAWRRATAGAAAVL